MLLASLLLALAATLLFVPLTADISIHRDGELKASASLRWGRFRLPSSAEGASPRKQQTARRPARSRRPKPGRKGARQVRALLFSRDFLPSLQLLVRRLLRRVEVRDLDLRLAAGLGDPADTGRLWGLLTPLLALLCALNTASRVAFEPDFSRRCLKLHCRATVRVVPATLLAVLLRYCFSLPPWRALSQYARAR